MGATGLMSAGRPPGVLARVPAIDGLRGLAVIGVLTTHSFFATPSDRSAHLDHVANLFVRFAGPVGVDLFFVISGYLITAILDQTRTADHPYRTFYIRRILRIVPLYYLFLLTMPLLFGGLGEVFVGTPATRVWDWAFLTNIALAQSAPDVVGRLFSSFWSLAIEEQFYVLWPIVILSRPWKSPVRLCIGLILFSVLGRMIFVTTDTPHYGWLLMPTRFDGMAAGAMVALLQSRNPAMLRAWAARGLKVSGVTVPGLLIFLIAAFWHVRDPLSATLGNGYTGRMFEIVLEPLVAAVAAASLIATFVLRGPGRNPRWLESGPLVWIARYSYGMYALHVVVIIVLIGVGIPVRRPVAGLDLPYQLAFTGLVIGFSLVAGFLSWHLYEQFFLKLVPRYRYNAGGEPSPVVGAPGPVQPIMPVP